MTSVASTVSTITNTQECFGLAPSLAVCMPDPAASPSGPSAVCCDAVLKYNKAGCFCSPITSVLFGADLTSLFANAELPACAATRGKKHWKVSCGPLQGHTYNSGTCPMNDMEMDAARFITASTFQAAVTKHVYDGRWGSDCFKISALLDQVAPLADPGYFASGSYGLGIFRGIKMAMEYFAILNSQLNRNNAVVSINPNKNVVGVLQDGSIVLGGYSTWSFMNETITAPEAYIEFIYSFDGCNTATVLSTTIPAGSVLRPKKNLATTLAYINGILTLGLESANWGAMNTCKFHSRYCTGSNQQFDTEKACVNYFTSLPVFSPTCGYGHILGGNSRICRANHQYLTVFDPEVHCPHLSPGSMACRDPGPNDEFDTFCGPGGSEEVMEKIYKHYRKQVREITVKQNATVLNPLWKWDYPQVC
ncbi:hypothetical protein HDU98_006986 [Podochytrium sp. JEL0797]|nr:hypothetical protein HDU98_006986 [Podochytrium sp. JEL0797]